MLISVGNGLAELVVALLLAVVTVDVELDGARLEMLIGVDDALGAELAGGQGLCC